MAVGGEQATDDLASSCILLELSEWFNEKENKQAETCDKHWQLFNSLVSCIWVDVHGGK